MSSILKIENLVASVQDKEILKGLNLEINAGEVHVIMGPNGAGKSTLAHTILSNPAFNKASGKIYFLGEDITNLSTDKIARLGVFLSHQTPEEIEGISVFNFLKTARSKISSEPIYFTKFKQELMDRASSIDMKNEALDRDLNVGFSGGEKKKCEMLQMLTLNPKLAILDETDSGLDIDSINAVSKSINMFRNEDNALLIITHSMKLLKYIPVTHVHILVDGRIVKSGDYTLAEEIDKRGYKDYRGELND